MRWLLGQWMRFHSATDITFMVWRSTDYDSVGMRIVGWVWMGETDVELTVM